MSRICGNIDEMTTAEPKKSLRDLLGFTEWSKKIKFGNQTRPEILKALNAMAEEYELDVTEILEAFLSLAIDDTPEGKEGRIAILQWVTNAKVKKKANPAGLSRIYADAVLRAKHHKGD